MKKFLYYKKNQKLPVEKNYKIITFQFRQLEKLWFGFPLRKVLRVIIGKQQYCNPQQPQIMKASYQGVQKPEIMTISYQQEQMLVINVDQYIFNQNSHRLPIINNKHLLLFDNDYNDNIIALPIDSPPQILEVKKSELRKLPPKFEQIGNITLFSNKIVIRENHPVYIMLSPGKMIIDQD